MHTNVRISMIGCLLVGTAACSSIRPVREPARFIAEQKPPVVYVGYVTEGVGYTREMTNPQIVGDSVVGTWTEGNSPASIPMRDVHSVAALRRDGARTAMLLGGAAVVTGVMAYVLLQNAAGNNDWYCDYSPNRRGPFGEPYCGPREPGTSALRSR